MQRAINIKELPVARQYRESAEQKALFRWVRLHLKKYPGLEYMFAIPNGAFLQGGAIQRAKQWKRLKAEGAREGVSDILLPVPRGRFHSLWMELKASDPYASTVSDDQQEWIDAMLALGFHAEVCKGWEAATEVIKTYYALGDFKWGWL